MAKVDEEKAIAIAALVVIAVVIAGVAAAGYAFKSASCGWRWSGAYETSYSALSGCKVVIDGKTIPEANVRQL